MLNNSVGCINKIKIKAQQFIVIRYKLKIYNHTMNLCFSAYLTNYKLCTYCYTNI